MIIGWCEMFGDILSRSECRILIDMDHAYRIALIKERDAQAARRSNNPKGEGGIANG
jgi:hypothetical protein